MADHRMLLDTFAEARRTWDELVGLQPDVMAGSRQLKEAELAELSRRVESHQSAIELLAAAVEIEPPDEEDIPDLQTSHKAASRAIAQKERDAPKMVAGAFGREPKD
ncbi:MAG TPA: hypothetical protein VEU08_17365 [Vicinamibacterales bacterium]|nr:hypothetical protein [Vicinamibacterales bacterium]